MYLYDHVYRAVWDEGDLPLREAMDLAYLTGQRPADILKIDERDTRDGVIAIRQNKTGTRLRIEIVGELAALLDRLAARKANHNPRSTNLIVDEQGRPLGQAALRLRFDRGPEGCGDIEV